MNFFLLIAIFFVGGLPSKSLPELKKYINFSQVSEKGESLKPEDTCSFDNLRVWANFQSLKIQPDNPSYGLKDGLCRTIPMQGLTFFLTADPNIKSTLYLYLDLTTYEFIGQNKFPPQTLEVKINNRKKEIIRFEPGFSQRNPAVIAIYPEEFPDGRMDISLTPNDTATGRFWGIWDVFYSYEKGK